MKEFPQMGRVRVRFFANFREKAGLEETTLEIRDKTTVAQVIGELAKSLGALKELFKSGSVIVAVNHEVAVPELIVKDGDEIAIFPPVSGG